MAVIAATADHPTADRRMAGHRMADHRMADHPTVDRRPEDRMVGAAIQRPRRMGRVPLEEALMAAPDRMGVLVPPAARMEAQVLTEAIAELGLI